MDLSKLGRTEQVLSGAGVLLFIISFLPWFGVSEDAVTWHADAWSWPSGFNDWFPIMLLFLYAVVLALPAFGVAVRVPVLESAKNRALVGLALSVFALLLIAIQGITYPGGGFGYTAGPSWAYFIGLIIVLGIVAESYLGFTRQGGSLAGIGAALQGQGQGPAANPQQAPTQQVYPQQGYPPPAQGPYQGPNPGPNQGPYSGPYPGQGGGQPGQAYPPPQGSYPPPNPPVPQPGGPDYPGTPGQAPYPGPGPQQPPQQSPQPPQPPQQQNPQYPPPQYPPQP